MKIKHGLLFVIAVFFVVLYTGCRRSTPHDFFLPDPGCKKLGYYSHNYTNYHFGNYIYSINATLDTTATITSISANIKNSNTAVVMIYDGASGSLLAKSDQTSVRDGWNKIVIPVTSLSAGTYRLAIMTINDSSSGIRSESGMGTRYSTGNSWPNVPATLTGGSAGNYMLLMYGNYCD